MSNTSEELQESEPEIRADDSRRVVVLSGSYPPMSCGVGDSAHALAHALAGLGVKIEVLADKLAQAVSVDEGPVPVHADVAAWGLGGLKKLVRAIEGLSPDILHIHYPTKAYGKGLGVPFLPMFIRARRKPIKIVVTLHEFKLSHPARRMASFILVDGADAVCMPCPLELEALKRRHISVTEKLSAAIPVPPVGPSPDNLDDSERRRLREDVRRGWGVDDEQVVLLHYGTPTPSKGLEVLFKAMRLLKLEGEEPLLVIVGDHRPQENEFHKLLHNQPGGLRVRDQVRWLGRLPVEELPGAFLASDIGVFPFLDGFSFRRSSLVSVLVWDLPIITTEPDGDLDEAFSQEKVRFCARNDPRALATALIPLVANRKALELARSLPNPLKEVFDPKRIALRYVDIYSQVLKKR